jgi:hypothetical protein
MDSIDIVTILLVQEIHTKSKKPHQRHVFGQWSAEEDAKAVDLSKVGKDLFYLHGSGIKCRTIEVLDGLRVIDGGLFRALY